MEENVGKSGLTAASVARAKPKEKPYKLSDRDGLYLLVKPSGTRYWRMNCRFHHIQRTIDSVEKPATEIEAGTSLGTVWKARPGYASAGAAGIGISFANLRRF
jgi:hypothetical protein